MKQKMYKNMNERFENIIKIPSTEYNGIIKVQKIDGEKDDISICIPDELFLKEHPAFLFDESSGNLHLHPPIECAIEWSDEINDKLIDIRKKLDEKINNLGKDNECKIRRVSSKMYRNIKEYKRASHLFDYISVKYKNQIFQITCTSFNKDTDNALVIEIIKAIQFIQYNTCYSIEHYPEKGKVFEESIVLYKDAAASFYDTDSIVSEFVDFIFKEQL